MPQQLVYVHGAGPQKPASILKHDIDMRVFGKDMSTTRLGYYANVRWPPSGGVAGPAITATGSSRGRRTRRLVTIGCPLGIGNVQNRLRNGAARPHPVPPMLTSWSNFADRWDPVALDQTMRDEFEPPKNEQVNNPAPDNHELMGYLSVAIVRDTIVAAAE